MLCHASQLHSDHLLCAAGLLRAVLQLHDRELLHSSELLCPTSDIGKLGTIMTRPTTDAIWLHLSSDLRQFILRRVRDEHVADDLLQETFLRVHRNIETLLDAERLAAWVYQIARNVVHDYFRRALNLPEELAEAENLMDDDLHPSTVCQGFKWLNDMIQSLPDGYRQAVHLAEIEQRSQQDVANSLGLSLSGAKSRIQRGRVMLKDVLQQCCSFEMDGRGQVLGCDPKPNQQVCRNCDTPNS